MIKNKFIILWHNGEWDNGEDTLEGTIAYVRSGERWNNYGHRGATVIEPNGMSYVITNETRERFQMLSIPKHDKQP